MKNEELYLQNCRGLIEAQLHWGSSQYWQNQDYENLSELIFQKTKVSLSSTTLKRIWGKVPYRGFPNIATLNALAQFAGHLNWAAFVASEPLPATTHPPGTPSEQPQPAEPRTWVKPKLARAWAALALVTLGALAAGWFFYSRPRPLRFAHVKFSSEPIALGVPNTVVFEYDAAHSNADSVFIQQDWDNSRRTRVDKFAKKFTSTYYSPGFFRAKLVLNDSVVCQHGLLIGSGGWLGTIDQSPRPAYFKAAEIVANGITGISPEQVKAQQIDLTSGEVWTSLHQVGGQMRLPGDKFVMEADLRHTFTARNLVCQKSRIVLWGTDGVISIPLSIVGCVGELNLYLRDRQLSGKLHDFRRFGVDFQDWANVKCTVQNQRLQIMVNGQLAYKGDFKPGIGQVVGASFKFLGTGQVRNFTLKPL
ncbi:MAG: hypothetical protein MUC97_19585 [Bernardetiaceae bacterium]|jgi:hypothetical protein|nr:hypothetical protein [Bernardetiaceae bacterium]